MGANDDPVIRLQKNIKDAFPVPMKNGAFPPGRSYQHNGWMIPRGRFRLYPGQHGIQIGKACYRQLFFRQMTERLQHTDPAALEGPGQQDRVIIVNPKHPVGGQIRNLMRDMHVPFHIPGALPLVYIEAGRAGKHKIRPKHVHAGVCPVALSGKFHFDMLIGFRERRIIFGGRQIQQPLTALFHLVTNGFKHVPVPLAVREDDIRPGILLRFSPFSPADPKAGLHRSVPQRVDQRPDYPDQYGEQHTSRTGVYIQFHSVSSLSNVNSSPKGAGKHQSAEAHGASSGSRSEIRRRPGSGCSRAVW